MLHIILVSRSFTTRMGWAFSSTLTMKQRVSLSAAADAMGMGGASNCAHQPPLEWALSGPELSWAILRRFLLLSRHQCRTKLRVVHCGPDLPIHSHRLRISLLHMDLQTQVGTVLSSSLPPVQPRKTWLIEVLHVQAVSAVVELKVGPLASRHVFNVRFTGSKAHPVPFLCDFGHGC